MTSPPASVWLRMTCLKFEVERPLVASYRAFVIPSLAQVRQAIDPTVDGIWAHLRKDLP